MATKLMLVFEVEGVRSDAKMQALLDRYREIAATSDAQVAADVTLVRATFRDVQDSGLLAQALRSFRPSGMFIESWTTRDPDLKIEPEE